MFLACAVFYCWRRRLCKTSQPRLNLAISKTVGIVFGLLLFLVGVIWFREFSELLSSIGPGTSREHFGGIVGIVFGTLLAIFGLGFSFVSLLSIDSIENWVTKEQEDIQLW